MDYKAEYNMSIRKFKVAKLEHNVTREEALDCLNIISQIASAHGCVVPDAQIWMGNYCETVVKDLKTAAMWFKKASDNGNGDGARCYADRPVYG